MSQVFYDYYCGLHYCQWMLQDFLLVPHNFLCFEYDYKCVLHECQCVFYYCIDDLHDCQWVLYNCRLMVQDFL